MQDISITLESEVRPRVRFGRCYRKKRVEPELSEDEDVAEGSVKRVKIELDDSRQMSPEDDASVRSNRSLRSTRSMPESVNNPLLDAEIQNLSQLEADRVQAVYLADAACKDAARSLEIAEEAWLAAQRTLEDMGKEKKLAERRLRQVRREKEKVVGLKEERAGLARRMREIDDAVKKRRND